MIKSKASWLGAAIGVLIALSIVVSQRSHQQSARSDDSTITVLGDGSRNVESRDVEDLTEQAAALRNVSLSQCKLMKWVDAFDTISHISDEEDREFVYFKYFTQNIIPELRRTGTEEERDDLLAVILEQINEVESAFVKASALSKLAEEQSKAQNNPAPTPDSDTLLKEALKAAASVPAGTNEQPWYRRASAFTFTVGLGLVGFVVTNLAASILEEIGVEVVKRTVRRTETQEKRT